MTDTPPVDAQPVEPRHPVYPGGPPCQPNCPGPWSMYHDGYSDGYENALDAARAGDGLDVERLAEALHRSGECRMWPPGDPPMTHNEAMARVDVHETRHFITARVIAAQYAALHATATEEQGHE